MNRAMRRLAERGKLNVPPPRVNLLSRPLDEFEQFDEIDKLAQKLAHGAIECQQGRPIMIKNGEPYDVISALEGWIEYWHALAIKHGIDWYVDEPMRVVRRRLENSVPLTQDHVDGFNLVVAAQRSLFRAIPRAEITSQAKTTQIKLLLDGK